jgi:hypothetical protein
MPKKAISLSLQQVLHLPSNNELDHNIQIGASKYMIKLRAKQIRSGIKSLNLGRMDPAPFNFRLVVLKVGNIDPMHVHSVCM